MLKPVRCFHYVLFDSVVSFPGDDWKWGNQDGGRGNVGHVISVDRTTRIAQVCLHSKLQFVGIIRFCG